MKSCVLLVACFLVIACKPVAAAGSTVFDDYRNGFALAKSGDYEQALRVWLPIIKSKEKRRQLTLRRRVRLCLAASSAYSRLGRDDKALRILEFARKLAPESKAVARAIARLDKKNCVQTLDEDIASLRTALLSERLSPGSCSDQFASLIPGFKKALAADERSAPACYGLGTCLLYTEEDPDEAIKYLKRSLELQPKNPEVSAQLAVAYRRKNLTVLELEQLQICLECGRPSAELHADLARAYGKRNFPEDRDKILYHVEEALGYDASYGDGIADYIADYSVRGEVVKMVREAQEKAAENRSAELMRERRENEARVRAFEQREEERKKREREREEEELMNGIPARYRGMAKRYRGVIKTFLGK